LNVGQDAGRAVERVVTLLPPRAFPKSALIVGGEEARSQVRKRGRDL